MNLIGVSVGEPYPPYQSLAREEIAAMGAALRMTSLAHHFSASAAA
jgi:hypothetical protein